MFARISRFFFGEDVFISYSRDDGGAYATACEKQLSAAGIVCYVDQLQPSPGKEIPPEVHRGLARSSMLLVVATRGALNSKGVAEEIVEFRNKRRPIQVLDLVGIYTVSTPPIWLDDVAGAPIVTDYEGALSPSKDVILRVQSSVGYWRRSRRLFYASIGAAALVTLSVVLGAVATMVFTKRAVDAEGRRAAAERGEARAREREKELETKIPRLEASVAQAEAAVQHALEKLASANEDITRKQTVLTAQDLASSGRGELGRDPELATLLAKAAVETSPTPQTVHALREALGEFVPRLAYGKACVAGRGRFALSLDLDSVRLWDLQMRRVVWKAPPSYRGTWVECSPEALRAAVATRGEPTILFDLSKSPPALTKIALGLGEDMPRPRFALSPDGSRFLAADGGRARVWDAEGNFVGEVPMPANLEALLLVSPARVVTLDDQGHVQSIDLTRTGPESMTEIATVPKGTINGLRRTADGRFFVVASDRSRQLWRVEPPARLDILSGDLTMARDSRSAAVLSGNSISLFGFDSAVGRFDGPQGVYGGASYRFDCECEQASLALFPGPYRFMAIATQTASIRIWDPKTGIRLADVRGTALDEDFAISDDGKRLFTSAAAWTVFPNGPPESRELPVDGVVFEARLSADGRYLALWASPPFDEQKNGKFYWFKWTGDDWKQLWSDNASSRESRRGCLNDALVVSTMGRHLAVRIPPDILRTVDSEGHATDRGTVSPCTAIATSTDGHSLVRAQSSGEVFVTGRTKPIGVTHYNATAAAFSPDGSAISISGVGKTVLIELSDDRLSKSFAASVVAFGPAGERILVGNSTSERLELWQRGTDGWASAILVREFLENHPDLRTISWRIDGRFVLTTGRDNVLRVWDVSTGDLAWKVVGPRSGAILQTAAFLDSSRKILSVWSGIFRVDMCDLCRDAKGLVALADSRVTRQLTAAERANYLRAR